jgi:hypothetical protein
VRSRSIVGVVALMLAVAAIGAGPAFAQTPVVPSTIVAAQPDDPAKIETKAGDDEPKVEQSGNPGDVKPKAEEPKPEKPKAEEPKPEKPKAEEPKPEKPKAEEPKPEKPKPETPKAEKPKPETPKAEKPKAEKPKNDTAQAGAPSAKPNAPGAPRNTLEPQLNVAKAVSPRPRPAPSAATASGGRRVTTRQPAAKEGREAAHPPAAARAGTLEATGPARMGRDVADATPATSGSIAVTATATRRQTFAPRRASDGVTAVAAASLDRRQPPVPILEASEPRYDVALMLAVVFGAAVGFLFGRKVRRQPGPG